MRYDLGYQLRKSYFLNIFRKYSTSNKLNDELYYENIYIVSHCSHLKKNFRKSWQYFVNCTILTTFPCPKFYNAISIGIL